MTPLYGMKDKYRVIKVVTWPQVSLPPKQSAGLLPSLDSLSCLKRQRNNFVGFYNIKTVRYPPRTHLQDHASMKVPTKVISAKKELFISTRCSNFHAS